MLDDGVGLVSDVGSQDNQERAEKEAAAAAKSAAASKKKADAEKKIVDAKRAAALAAAKLARHEKEQTEEQKKRAKALAAARAALGKQVDLNGAGSAEREIFDLGELKKKFPEIGDLIGDRVRQVLGDVDTRIFRGEGEGLTLALSL